MNPTWICKHDSDFGKYTFEIIYSIYLKTFFSIKTCKNEKLILCFLPLKVVMGEAEILYW